MSTEPAEPTEPTASPAPTDPTASAALTTLALARFTAARLWAAQRAPYLARALFALTPVVLEARLDEATGAPAPDPGLRAFPCDSAWRVRVDPGTAAATPVAEFGWWLLHGVGHLVRRHHERAPEAGADAEEVRRWNRAADAEVNDDLEADGLTTPEGVVSPRALGLPEGRLAEEYASTLEVLEQAHARGGRSLIAPVDCGGAVHGLNDRYDKGGGEPGLDALDRDLLELALARAIRDRAADRSGVPCGWLRWAEERLRPSVDWRTRLGALLRRATHRAAGRVDFSYARPSRRSAWPVVLPSMVAPEPETVLVVDTSGSVTRPVLAGFVAEAAGLLPRGRLRVLCCDLRAHPAQRIRRTEEVRLVGGGGTDLREGITAALALRPRPDLVVVLTDGQTPWPERRPPVPLVLGLVSGDEASPSPVWAHTVHLPERPT